MIDNQDLTRYRRQMMLPGWGPEGQERLKQARVVIAGVGGLGSPVGLYLAAAGIGHIRLLDGDKVELSNLHRQIVHSMCDIDRWKVESARDRLQALNPEIEVEALGSMITADNVFDLVGDYAIVDAMDNLQARQLLNRVAVKRGLPYFHGAVYGMEGRITTIIPGETPCVSCLYTDVVSGDLPVVGTTPAVIGCLQATEVLKYFLGLGDLLTGRQLIYDGLALRFHEVKVKRDPKCLECASKYSFSGGPV